MKRMIFPDRRDQRQGTMQSDSLPISAKLVTV